MPTRANPHRPIRTAQTFIYDPARGVDERPALLDVIKAPWEFIDQAQRNLMVAQAAGSVSRHVKYATATTVSGYQLRIKRQATSTASNWTIKVKQIKKT